MIYIVQLVQDYAKYECTPIYNIFLGFKSLVMQVCLCSNLDEKEITRQCDSTSNMMACANVYANKITWYELLIHEQSMNHIFLKKGWPKMFNSHPLRRQIV